MRQRRGAALPAAVLLLGAIESSAQFNLGGLANINPQQIASTLSNKSPKDIAQDVIGSEHPKTIVEKAAKVIQKDGKKHVEQAAKTIAEAKQTVSDAIQDAGLSNVTQAIAGSAPAQPGAAQAATAASATLPTESPPSIPEDAPPSSPQKASVVDALKTASDVLQQAGKALNGTRHDALNGTSSQTVADALKGAIEQNLPQSLEQHLPKSLDKAQEVAKKAIESSPHTDALKKAGQGLADAFHIPTSPQDSHPQAANWIQDALKNVDPSKITHAIKHESPKVVDAIKKGDASAVIPKHSTGKSPRPVIRPVDGGDDTGMGWLPLGIAICLAIASVAGGWHLFTSFKRRDVRSPTLLTDAEMATWSHSGGPQGGRVAEEPLFRQF